PVATLFPYTTLFRSRRPGQALRQPGPRRREQVSLVEPDPTAGAAEVAQHARQRVGGAPGRLPRPVSDLLADLAGRVRVREEELPVARDAVAGDPVGRDAGGVDERHDEAGA